MLRNRLYYSLKPFLPRGLRMAVRRAYARRIVRRAEGVWPILESAGTPPAGWSGWPGDKQFAVVLTHDVESLLGLGKVRPLAELEMSLGFRSSFNFVPEGEYRVPDDLRHWLTNNGVEVGIHDHRHDGKLYCSRAQFRRSAERINHYLNAWGAVGFRSGFMLHNLDWIHDLNIAYDASTFDTDPFEPQPDGIGTIFPFWVPAPGQRSEDGGQRSEVGDRQSVKDGYVELPYTLPQDSTLFLLLGETSPAVWKHKADWIAKRGGMVLMNVHPDYFNLTELCSADRGYPLTHYREVLLHLRERYAGQFWSALPRQIADFARGLCPS